MRETDTHIYFWTNWLSNFHKCPIKYKNLDFHCSEQLYMLFKAMYFADTKSAKKLIRCRSAREAKNLGRNVTPFDQDKWNEVSFGYMFLACFAKFSQNKTIKQKLLETGNKILVEASPMDNIWGVGLTEDDDKILDEKNWTGENRLGKVLMKVREELRK